APPRPPREPGLKRPVGTQPEKTQGTPVGPHADVVVPVVVLARAARSTKDEGAASFESHRAVDVRHEVLILGMHLIVHDLMTSPTETIPTSFDSLSTGTLAIRRSLIWPITSLTSSSRLQVTGSRVMTSATRIVRNRSPQLWKPRRTSRSLKMPTRR